MFSVDRTTRLLLCLGRIVNPPNHQLRLNVVSSMHDGKVNGNPGQMKTVGLVMRAYHFKGLPQFVNTFVAGCHAFRRNKPVRHAEYGTLQPLPIPSGPWRSIGMDAIVKLSFSQGMDAIQVLICRFTKMVDLVAYEKEGFDSPNLAQMFQHTCSDS